MKQRNHFLDIAKGVAVLLVIITHFSWKESERLRYLFPFWVSMAVPIFMIVFGYANAASFEKKNIQTLHRAYAPDLLLRKFARFTVPFAIAYVFNIIFHSILEEKLSLRAIIVYFFRGGVGEKGTYYYPVLLQLIFLFPVLYFIIKRYENGLLLCFIMNVVYELLARICMVNGKCYRLLSFRYLFLIAFGCYLYEYKGNKLKNKNWILFLTGTAFIIATDYLGYEPLTVTYWERTCVYAVLYFLPLFSFAMAHGKNLRCRFLEMLGQASYHVFFVQMLYYNYWENRVGAWMPNRACHLLVNILICVSVGIAYYYLETPVSRYVMKKLENVPVSEFRLYKVLFLKKSRQF